MKKFMVMGVLGFVVVVLFSQVGSAIGHVFKCLSTALGGGQC